MEEDKKNDNIDIKTKRPPGRPRLKSVKKNIIYNSISGVPRKDTNSMEFIYDDPILFRKSLHIFKHLSVNEISINFNAENVVMSAINNNNTEVIVVFDCNKINHYYCETPMSVTLNALNVEKVNKVIDSDIVKVTMIVKKSSSRSSIIFIFQNEKCIINTYEVNLIQPAQTKQVLSKSFNVDDYAIKFNISDKFLKKIIINSSLFSELIILRQVGNDGNLTFSHSTDDKMIKSSYIISDSKFINLESKVEPLSIFNVSINIDYIKPLANAMISNIIRVNVDEHQKIVFVGSLDNDAITISVSCVTETD